MTTIRSEWVKFRSLRSLLATVVAVIVLTAGLGCLFAYARARHTDGDAFDPTAASLSGILLAQIAVCVLGVLTISSEFASGTIRSSLVAVPGRSRLLAAKAATLTVVALVIGWAGGLAAFLLGQPLVRGEGVAAASLADPAPVRAVVGAGLYLTIVALFGLALGALIRSTAGALTTAIVVLLMVPIFSPALPDGMAAWVSRWWPSMAGLRVATVVPDPAALGPWEGLSVLAGFVAATLLAAFLGFRRRDV
ncbi:ABC transporter permease [Actinoplanes sp. NPDC026619]|uniref:ABC transporter permease n=1 Tax=Actinoplanes sp. NPDC026619 TaxID=3155798 RepID=UPI0033E82E25